MKQMAIRRCATQLTAPTKQTTIPAAADNTLRFVQRCSRPRRLALEYQLREMQPNVTRLGRLLDLEA